MFVYTVTETLLANQITGKEDEGAFVETGNHRARHPPGFERREIEPASHSGCK
jgi:hypothetical protein